jgi:Flp pilus assembly protein TadD
MPQRPEPKNNMGLVYESVGRIDEAQAQYDAALVLSPDNAELIGNLARARIRKGLLDDRTRELLENLVLKDTRPDWVAWARERLVLLPKPSAPPDAPPDARPN